MTPAPAISDGPQVLSKAQCNSQSLQLNSGATENESLALAPPQPSADHPLIVATQPPTLDFTLRKQLFFRKYIGAL